MTAPRPLRPLEPTPRVERRIARRDARNVARGVRARARLRLVHGRVVAVLRRGVA